MKFIEIPKTTREEWLQWRHNGIGSSDVPIIMGVSRFKSKEELFAEKTKPVAVEDEVNGYIKDRGNRIEMTVRAFYEAKMTMTFTGMACQDAEHPHRIVTLDGIDEGKNLIVEIKLMTSQKEDKINVEAEGYKKWVAAKDGKIPVDYYPQIQHQLAVTGAPACVFLGYKEVRVADKQPRPVTEDDVAIVTVLPDLEYIKVMNEKIDDFWNKVLEARSKNGTI